MNLILIRHGQSEWNALNQFTGWKDPDLTAKGIEEAHNAGMVIINLKINFDLVFTSALIRAQNTAEIILKEINQSLSTIKNQALNERNYGDLAGLNKDDARKRWGDEQVHIWRRSYDVLLLEEKVLKIQVKECFHFLRKKYSHMFVKARMF